MAKARKSPSKGKTPKRYKNAYLHFLDKERKTLKGKSRPTEVKQWAKWTKNAAAKYRKLSDRERAPFEKMAARDRKMYEAKMKKLGRR